MNPEQILQALGQKIAEMYGDGSDANLRAIAAEVIAPLIDADVQAESLLDLVLERVPRQLGEIKWAKKPEHKAYTIAEDGSLVNSPDRARFITPTGYLVTAFPTFPRLDLERGYVGSVNDQITAAKDAIINKLNAALMTLITNAQDADNTVTPGSATLTEGAINSALSKAEDLGLQPVAFLMRGSRFNDVRSITFPDPVAAELTMRGVQGVKLSGARVILNASVPSRKVMLLTNMKPGKVMDEFPIRTGEVKDVDDTLDLGVKIYQVVKMAITNPKRFVVIDLDAA